MLRHEHAFAPTGRATGKVRAARRLPVISRCDLFRKLSHTRDGDLRKIEACPLIRVVAPVKRGVGSASLSGVDYISRGGYCAADGIW